MWTICYHSVVHPCRSHGSGCCGGANKSSSLLRYTFSEEQSITANTMQMRVTFSAQQRCGDGAYLKMLLYFTSNSTPTELLSLRLKAGTDADKRRDLPVDVRTFQAGTRVDMIVDPLEDQDCDGVYISVHISEGK